MSVDTTDLKKAVAANKMAWDQSAKLHLENKEWDDQKAGFSKPGFSTFDATMSVTLERLKLQGKSVVQIGCNNGRETLSLSAFGATGCLGIDQSDEFLKQAEILKHIAQSDCEFLSANIYDLPQSVRKDFDMGLITIGVLSWMPDLVRFFQEVRGLLQERGELVIYETHPFLEMFDPASETPHVPAYSYFTEKPFVETAAITYDGETGETVTPSYWYIHKIGDIINALITAGFSIHSLEEHPHSNREVDYDIYENQDAQVPMSFTLIAKKEGN